MTNRLRIHAGKMPRQLQPRKRREHNMATDDGIGGNPENDAREEASVAPKL